MRLSSRHKQRLLKKYGSWSVVTGASSGIGREIALLLAEAGLNLVLVARSQQQLEPLAEELSKKHGIQVKALPLDLSVQTSMATLASATQDLDVGLLVAAAGFGSSGTFLKASLEQETNMLQVNCQAVLAQSLYFAQRFATQKRGGMILFGSIVGFQGVPNSAHYAATKAYVQSLAEALYVELKPLGVDVLASAPGPTRSGFAQRANMTLSSALDPREVALATLNALGFRQTVLPGGLSKLIVYSLATLPRWARVRIMGQVMGGMANH